MGVIEKLGAEGVVQALVLGVLVINIAVQDGTSLVSIASHHGLGANALAIIGLARLLCGSRLLLIVVASSGKSGGTALGGWSSGRSDDASIGHELLLGRAPAGAGGGSVLETGELSELLEVDLRIGSRLANVSIANDGVDRQMMDVLLRYLWLSLEALPNEASKLSLTSSQDGLLGGCHDNMLL